MAKSGPKEDALNEAMPAASGSGGRVLSTFDVVNDLEDEADVLERGTSVGRYLVLERLGAGAMGVVYAAYDQELDRKIAIKVLRRRDGHEGGTTLHQRLIREAKAIAKLSHPNVVGIFDVGVHEGQVFLAMEYLGGGTLRDWLGAKKRHWREIVRMFVEVGRGLAAAHVEGLIHRDFKPDNVLLDKAGKPKVVDFGLVRLANAALDASTTGAAGGPAPIEGPESVAPVALPSLTGTGALTGTPAYMAPEQFLGRPIDARTDQFAFCVALYEALYGERPFAGETVMALAGQVAQGRIRAIPKASDVPTWVRACVIRGLQVDPAERHRGFDELLAVFASDPIARRRRRLLAAGASLLVVAGAIAIRHVVLAKRHEIEEQAVEQIRQADALLTEAAAKSHESTTLRERAFAAFDTFDRETGETLWGQALAAAQAADTGYQHGVQRLEAAVALTPRRDLKDRIAIALVDYIEMDGRSAVEREAAIRQLALYDQGRGLASRLDAPAILRIETTPAGLMAEIESYDSLTHALAERARSVGPTPVQLSLPPGSYRLSIKETTAHVGFTYPILLSSGERYEGAIRVPLRSSVPKDFVYVPEGRSLFGSANEELRTAFLGTVPIHSVNSSAFLISRYETTIGEWIAFLEALPPAEREKRRPHGRKDVRGGLIEVRQTPREGWEVQFRATDQTMYRAREGEALQYADRARRISQDWLRFPVTGISPTDALAYVTWLDRSGRVPGARLCTEREWERAARGADGREFPHGDRLSPDDANFDLTYGRKNGAFGLDEVGSHPASVSPFLIDDMAGNAWDMAVSVLDRDQFVVRGGSFYQGTPSLRVSNRDPIGALTRDHTVGLRVCANPRI